MVGAVLAEQHDESAQMRCPTGLDILAKPGQRRNQHRRRRIAIIA
jgi:hypothetical protein